MSTKLIVILALVLLVAAAIVILLSSSRSLRKVEATANVGGSDGPGVSRAHLVDTGMPARAVLVAIKATGLVVTRANFGCQARFRLEPLDGRRPFEAETTLVLNVAQMPRPGDVWPGWYDPEDPTQIEVRPPDLFDPRMPALLEEFGIANPLAPSAER